MKKFFYNLSGVFFLSIFVSFFSTKALSFWRDLYGIAPEHNSIFLGSLTYHFIEPKKEVFYPMVAISMKNSLYTNVVKSTYNSLVVSLGITRDWYRTQFNFKNNSIGVDFGYYAGITYGYCIKNFMIMPKKSCIPIIPSFMVFSNYTFNGKFGIQLFWAGAVISSTLYMNF